MHKGKRLWWRQKPAGPENAVSPSLGRARLFSAGKSIGRLPTASSAPVETTILDALPEYLVVLDCHGAILATNAAWQILAQKHGLTQADYAPGQPYAGRCADIFHVSSSESEADEVSIPGFLIQSPKSVQEYPWVLDGDKRWLRLLATRSEADGQCRVVLMYLDITDRKAVEQESQARAEQQAVVAELGQRALSGIPLARLHEEAVTALAQTFKVEYAKILMVLSSQSSLLVAGVGWKEGLVGTATVDLQEKSQAGFTLASDSPVVVADLRTETRFSGPALLHEHNVVSGISVLIRGRDGPWGILSAHTTKLRPFSRDDVNFLRSVANVLAEATERSRSEASLRRSSALLHIAARTAHIGGWSYDPRGDVMT